LVAPAVAKIQQRAERLVGIISNSRSLRLFSEPVNEIASAQAQYPVVIPQYPISGAETYPAPMQQLQMQQMAPMYGQPAQAPYGMYAPNQATTKEDSDTSSDSDSSSDSD